MEQREGKMEFFYQFDDGHPAIKVTLSPHTPLGEIFETFEGFLRAAGYHFDGLIDLVEPEPEFNNEATEAN